MTSKGFVTWLCRTLTAAALLLSWHVGSAGDMDLLEATKQRDFDTLQRLLDTGADPNARQPDGATALHWAVHASDSSSVSALLEAGADVNVSNRLGASALFVAARNGDATMVETLLQAGANPNLALEMGETPLMTASRAGAVRATRLLIEAGASVNKREQSRLQTALMWAAAQNHLGVASELIDAGADLEARSRTRAILMFVDAANGGAFDQGVMENLGGYTALLFAARKGSIEMTRLLLEAGADIDGEAANGASPLVIASHSGHSELARFLLQRGADPNAMGAGYNALHAAILRGDQPLVKALLKQGANPDVRIKKATPVQRASEDWVLRTHHIGATPYWLAAYFREPQIMQTLVDWGANPLLTNKEQFQRLRDRASRLNPPAPEDRKVVGGFSNAIQAAILGGSDRNRFYVIQNFDPVGEERLTLEAVRVAAEHGVSPQHADFTGATALHFAAVRNLPSVVRELAQRGADVNADNGRGQTPLDLANLTESRTSFFNFALADKPGPTASEVLIELGAGESELSQGPPDQQQSRI